MFYLHREMLYLLQRERRFYFEWSGGEKTEQCAPNLQLPPRSEAPAEPLRGLGEDFHAALSTQPTDLDLTVHTQQML